MCRRRENREDIGANEFCIGDINCDQSIDLPDFAAFQNCFGSSPVVGVCLPLDFNAGSAIDLLDFAVFAAALNP